MWAFAGTCAASIWLCATVSLFLFLAGFISEGMNVRLLRDFADVHPFFVGEAAVLMSGSAAVMGAVAGRSVLESRYSSAAVTYIRCILLLVHSTVVGGLAVLTAITIIQDTAVAALNVAPVLTMETPPLWLSASVLFAVNSAIYFAARRFIIKRPALAAR